MTQSMDDHDGWEPIATAPKNGMRVKVYAPGFQELPPILTTACWDEGAGWCVCELREVSHWRHLTHEEFKEFFEEDYAKKSAQKTPSIGHLIADGVTVERDAVHVAILPVRAAENLVPGTHVGVVSKGLELKVGLVAPLIGVVDPLLPEIVLKGQRFFLWMYPHSVKSLKHVWTHPVVDNAAEKLKAKIWLEDFAEEIGISYKELMQGAENHIDHGGYVTLNYDTPDVVYKKASEFWKHYEIMSGQSPSDAEDMFFTCAC